MNVFQEKSGLELLNAMSDAMWLLMPNQHVPRRHLGDMA